MKIQKAIHDSGGNFFNDMKINIGKSHEIVDEFIYLSPPNKNHPKKRSYLANKIHFFFDAITYKLKLREFLINNYFIKEWFREFYNYWSTSLSGRPINVTSFNLLSFDYRKKNQHPKKLNWDTPTNHINNWQGHSTIFLSFFNAKKLALIPIHGYQLWKIIKKNSKILEYGCSLAPYYDSYRKYYNHKKCQWYLADIDQHPFHFAKHKYLQDSDVKKFITITSEKFRNPVPQDSNFDVIILTAVLEHLDDPMFVTTYLTEKLSNGGLLVFDYIKSEGLGLDTPKSLALRKTTLKFILDHYDIIHGQISLAKDVGFTIAKKKVI